MNTTTRILIVEDNPADLEFIKYELRKGGVEYTVEVVQTKEDFENALKTFVPDLILSDYALPSFDGPTAFEIRTEISPDTPFIFVSGTIGEENSVEYIKKGVTDYVLKDKLFSLTTKVKRALKESQEHQFRRKAEQEKEFDRNNLYALLNNTHDLMWSVDRDFKLITANEPFDEMSKVNFGRVVEKGGNILSTAHTQEMLNHFKLQYERAFAGETFTETEHFQIPFEFWSEVSYYPIRKDDKVIGTACHSRDITKQKKAERHLRLLESVITHANDAVLITEAEPINEPGPKIVYANDAFTKMTGYNASEVIGKTPRLLQGPKTDRLQLDDVRVALQKQLSIEVELINYKKNGEEFWNNFTIVPVMDDEGRYTHSVSIQRDATSRRQAEEITRTRLERLVEARTTELNVALAKEKQLVELRNNFISVASHEFRTPLSTISLAAGFVRKYQQKMKPFDVDSKMAGIERQVHHMTNLLDDVLMVGKAAAGKVEIKISLISIDFLEQLAKEVVNSTGTKHHLQISCEGTRKSFPTDQKLIRAIIINLITNAIKFSPDENAITVNFTCNEENLLITVKDGGIGIPVEDLKNLFSAFSRGSNVAAIEGTGLGLSIVKNACDLLKGSIRVESELGQGTEFIVTLPLTYD